MRRLNYAWKVCGTSGSLAANQIQCAVSHTNPRSLSLSSYEEKAFFQMAVRLNRGFYFGQESRLDIFEFVSVSFIFEYLSQFEVHFNDRVRPENLIRAVQEDQFPEWFTRQVIQIIFEGQVDSDFSIQNFISLYYFARNFFYYSDGMFMKFENFEKMLKTDKLPNRLKDYIKHTWVPSQPEIEEASKLYYKGSHDEDYFKTYNNLIFLQTGKKLRKKTKSDTNIKELIEKQEFPADGAKLIFSVYDQFRNSSIFIEDWIHFMGNSYRYMDLTPLGVQRLNFETIMKEQNHRDIDPKNPLVKLNDEENHLE